MKKNILIFLIVLFLSCNVAINNDSETKYLFSTGKYSSNGDGSIQTKFTGSEYVKGTVISVTASPADDSKFSGWYDSDENGMLISQDRVYSFTIEKDTRLYAKFDKLFEVPGGLYTAFLDETDPNNHLNTIVKLKLNENVDDENYKSFDIDQDFLINELLYLPTKQAFVGIKNNSETDDDNSYLIVFYPETETVNEFEISDSSEIGFKDLVAIKNGNLYAYRYKRENNGYNHDIVNIDITDGSQSLVCNLNFEDNNGDNFGSLHYMSMLDRLVVLYEKTIIQIEYHSGGSGSRTFSNSEPGDYIYDFLIEDKNGNIYTIASKYESMGWDSYIFAVDLDNATIEKVKDLAYNLREVRTATYNPTENSIILLDDPMVIYNIDSMSVNTVIVNSYYRGLTVN